MKTWVTWTQHLTIDSDYFSWPSCALESSGISADHTVYDCPLQPTGVLQYWFSSYSTMKTLECHASWRYTRILWAHRKTMKTLFLMKQCRKGVLKLRHNNLKPFRYYGLTHPSPGSVYGGHHCTRNAMQKCREHFDSCTYMYQVRHTVQLDGETYLGLHMAYVHIYTVTPLLLLYCTCGTTFTGGNMLCYMYMCHMENG
jgi:hypothetical protein